MSVISSEVIEIRSYNPSIDKDYIYSTWLNSYKSSSYFAKRIRNPIFYKEHHKIIDHLIAKPTIQIRVVSPKDEPDLIAGYLIHELKEDHSVVHYIYTKKIYRKMGIAKKLFEAANLDPNKIMFTHWTYAPDPEHGDYSVNELIEKYPGMIYNPYCL